MPDDIALFNALYRTSIKGRKDIAKLMLNPDAVGKIDSSYTSRVAEVFNVILKSLSVEVEFIDDDEVLTPYDDCETSFHEINGMTVQCTDLDYMMLERLRTIENDITAAVGLIDEETLKNEIFNELKSRKYLIGESDEKRINRLVNLLLEIY